MSNQSAAIVQRLWTYCNVLRAERLRQAILKRAFEGKLVPQDPNDEPASELLKRIRLKQDKEAD